MSGVARIAAELSAVVPLDDLERAHLDDAIAWVNSGAPLYRLEKPATPPKHLVSYFAVIDGDRILLVDHRNAKLWLPTGGHVEPDEDPRAAVVREIREELGLDVPLESIGPPVMVTVTHTVGISHGHTDVSLWYTVEANQQDEISFSSEEFDEIRWFDFSDVPLERSDPHLDRFIEKLRMPLHAPRTDTTKKRDQLERRQQELDHAVLMESSRQLVVRAAEAVRAAQLSLLKAELHGTENAQLTGEDTQSRVRNNERDTQRWTDFSVDEILKRRP